MFVSYFFAKTEPLETEEAVFNVDPSPFFPEQSQRLMSEGASKKGSKKGGGGSAQAQPQAQAAAQPPPAAAPMEELDAMDLGTLPVDLRGRLPMPDEEMKNGMINDLVSMLRMMEQAPPESVEEFLEYLQAAREEMHVGSQFARGHRPGMSRLGTDAANAKKKPVSTQKAKAGTTKQQAKQRQGQGPPPAASAGSAGSGASQPQDKSDLGEEEFEDFDSSVSEGADDLFIREPINIEEVFGGLFRRVDPFEPTPGDPFPVSPLDVLRNARAAGGLEHAVYSRVRELHDDTEQGTGLPPGAAPKDSKRSVEAGTNDLAEALLQNYPGTVEDPFRDGAALGRTDIPDFLAEDLRDINALISKMAPLSQKTLEDLHDFWQLNKQNVDHLMMRTNVAERIRCLAVLFLLTVGRKFGAIPQNTLDDLVENLSLCLWQGAAALGPQSQQHVAVLFDLECTATHEEICVTVTGLGLTAFFQPLPVELLQRIQEELKLPQLNIPQQEADLKNEKIAHQLCQYFYPLLDTRKDMKLPCTVQLRAHENAPGKFTCTVDNARMMTVGLHQNYSSNVFTVNKMKFRARLIVHDQKLSFWVSPLANSNLVLVLHVKAAGTVKAPPGKGNPDGNGVQPFALTSQSMEVPVGGRIGFTNMLTLEEVFKNPKNSPHGLRLYSDDDRVTFQFQIEIKEVLPANANANGSAPAANAGQAKEQQPQGNGKGEGAKGKGGKDSAPSSQPSTPLEVSGKKKPPTPNPAKVTPSAAELLAQEEEEKKLKNAAKTSQKLEKKFQQLEATESVARETVVKGATQAWTTLSDEINKSWQKCLLKKKEKDRKDEQVRDDLQNQYSSLQGTVVNNRTAVAKLAGERTTSSKEVAKLQANLQSRKAVLEALQQKFSETAQALEQQEAELEALQKAKAERDAQIAAYEEALQAKEAKRLAKQSRREARAKQRAARAAQHQPLTASSRVVQSAPTMTSGWSVTQDEPTRTRSVLEPTTAHVPTAIQDFNSFWSTSTDGFNSATASSLFGGDPSPFSQVGPSPNSGFTVAAFPSSTTASAGPFGSHSSFGSHYIPHTPTGQEELALDTALQSNLSAQAPPFFSQYRPPPRGGPSHGHGGPNNGFPQPRSHGMQGGGFGSSSELMGLGSGPMPSSGPGGAAPGGSPFTAASVTAGNPSPFYHPTTGPGHHGHGRGGMGMGGPTPTPGVPTVTPYMGSQPHQAGQWRAGPGYH